MTRVRAWSRQGPAASRCVRAGQIGCDEATGCVGTAGTDILYVTAGAGQGKVYGDLDPSSFTYTVSGLEAGDTQGQAIAGGALSRITGENVGSYAITQGSLAANPYNYTISYVGDNFAITPAALTITGQNKVYGRAPAATASGRRQSRRGFTGAVTLSGRARQQLHDQRRELRDQRRDVTANNASRLRGDEPLQRDHGGPASTWSPASA